MRSKAPKSLQVEFYHRHAKRLTDANLLTVIGTSIASDGLVVDRLKDVTAKRLNHSYWHYIVPVMQVVA
jgi:hypothetical protein